ncbi:glycerol-3-phosphate dehydrogenase [Piscirickettsia salmonis]|uniref:Glycerol-3-phosphate dehydrogenase [NAD(P)+] n=1 Tax=Piscirickettsia salmonis TaxID=1238 RepID=A0A9Q6LJA8_PISSA|nr:NAD(P)H-dependent glycerol-3-phosphate dehydrogenase [Piscirickettsia salmonis]ALA26374.1 NAD-dependent glycerol-3-phosphate dehydrogenase family protein [Piscirickettsia salmonis]APS43803.1 glycerol-3-phosphate dehydrogenase [Piscirickettsia salmonis]APS47158.1 glycerol-3-phosphate dehydrogenase [Piscirickettsia salmonis]APS51401.1 glycerol-3-phosphate dehydrogenase [Piscirickettsia salmonis]APS54611.1 glycerol-3-phosphate dehydrogenase [Piscirickettsia salmonis]
MEKEAITVIGAGSWGTALACALARNGHITHLWGRDQQQMLALKQSHCNSKYLPDVTLPKSIQYHEHLAEAVEASGALVIAVPSHAFASSLRAIKSHITEYTDIISASKGVSDQSLFLDQVCINTLSDKQPFAVLSGPSFAKEVAAGLPTAITIAAHDHDHATRWVQRFHQDNFRTYTNHDVTGTQIGGAVKNIMAIAAGIASGLGYGANAQAALITRALAEIMRFGLALGAKAETLMGLTGLGDLVLTCSNNQSRNRRFGLALGQGKTAKEAENIIAQAVEGYHNARQVYQLAQKLKIDTPIINQVYRVLYEQLPIQQAVQELFARAPKSE